jgi:hypothetical protein
MEKDSKFAGSEQDVDAQIKTFGYYWPEVCGEYERHIENGMSPVAACDEIEHNINSDEEKFRTHARRSETPRTTVEAIRLMFKDRLSEKQIVKEAKLDDEFRRRIEIPPSEKRRILLDACRKIRIMQVVEQHKDRPRSRSAYRREPSRVSSRSRCTSRTAVASASSPGGDDSGGSEPPQSDPDLPSFRFVRSGILRSYLKTDRFLSSWRPGRPGLMAHVRRWAA